MERPSQRHQRDRSGDPRDREANDRPEIDDLAHSAASTRSFAR
jgi:hypothetical protein